MTMDVSANIQATRHCDCTVQDVRDIQDVQPAVPEVNKTLGSNDVQKVGSTRTKEDEGHFTNLRGPQESVGTGKVKKTENNNVSDFPRPEDTETHHQPIIHLVRHAHARESDECISFTGWSQSVVLRETFDYTGGRGPYITHLVTTHEHRAVQTMEMAFNTIIARGVQVRRYDGLRGQHCKAKKHGSKKKPCDCFLIARSILRKLIISLPLEVGKQKEVLIVTHRRFIDNILQRPSQKRGFRHTEFRSFIMRQDGTLKRIFDQIHELPTRSSFVLKRLKEVEDPAERWALQFRAKIEDVIEGEDQTVSKRAEEIATIKREIENKEIVWRTEALQWISKGSASHTPEDPKSQVMDTASAQKIVKEIENLTTKRLRAIEELEEALWKWKMGKDALWRFAQFNTAKIDCVAKINFLWGLDELRSWRLKDQTPELKAFIRRRGLIR